MCDFNKLNFTILDLIEHDLRADENGHVTPEHRIAPEGAAAAVAAAAVAAAAAAVAAAAAAVAAAVALTCRTLTKKARLLLLQSDRAQRATPRSCAQGTRLQRRRAPHSENGQPA